MTVYYKKYPIHFISFLTYNTDNKFTVNLKTKMMKEFNLIITPDWKGKVLLIVNNDDISFYYYVKLFNNSKAEIKRANNGSEAFQICRKEEIDIVIFDILAPLQEDILAIRKIKGHSKNAPVIIHTTTKANVFTSEFYDAGCEYVINKPIDCNNLITIINNNIKIK